MWPAKFFLSIAEHVVENSKKQDLVTCYQVYVESTAVSSTPKSTKIQNSHSELLNHVRSRCQSRGMNEARSQSYINK
jgi:hypothetical protein